jgi:hypothetical protein
MPEKSKTKLKMYIHNIFIRLSETNTTNTTTNKNEKTKRIKLETNLHPSWQAKKQEKLQNIPFTGKKIKFND